MNTKINQKELAGIEYIGSGGITSHCLDALFRIVNFGDEIHKARLLSCSGEHGFIIEINHGKLVAVKSGFASGYGGEGPCGLSIALQLLKRHGAEIDEFEVDEDVLRRIDDACLLTADIDNIVATQPVRPCRWHEYIYDIERSMSPNHERLRDKFRVTIPFQLIDSRIIDLAIGFKEHPDTSIMYAYRRLEDIVRERSGLNDEHGVKLFSKAFQGEDSIFFWKNLAKSEHTGRASLFTATYLAFRNKRAHKELEIEELTNLREFLLINELFLLEAEAIKRPDRQESSNKKQKEYLGSE